MATNTFNNMVKIAKLSMDCLENNLALAKQVTRKYEDMFKGTGAKQGETVNVRVPALGYALRTGSAAVPQGYVDTYVPVTLAQYGADMQFTSKELALNVEDGEGFKQNVLNPLVAPVANKLDTLLWDLIPGIANSVGTPGSKPSNIDHLIDAGALLSEGAVPRDGSWAGILHPRHAAGMLKGTTTYYNPSADISEQYRQGSLGRIVGGFKISDDANAPSGTVGAIGTSTPLMNGATADGATQIVTDGWASSAATLKVGDVITIAGVYAVNPVSKASTGQLKQFAVTEEVTSSGVDMTIKITPAIVASGVNQNVNAVPVDGAAIGVFGDTTPTSLTGVAYSQSLLIHPDCMTLCAVDMPKPESAVYCVRVRSPRLNIPIRLIQYYNGSSDQELFRLDILAGAALTRPNFGVKIVG